MKTIVIVCIGNVLLVPPVISLIKSLHKIGINVHLVTNKVDRVSLEDYFGEIVTISYISYEYEKDGNPYNKFIRMLNIRKQAFRIIDMIYDEQTTLWIVGDTTVKNLGKRLLRYRYIFHVLELSEDIYYHYKLKFLKVSGHQIGENAIAVVVPEYFRAHITKAWWNLSKMPYILPNKPFKTGVSERKSYIHNKEAGEIIEKIGDRKIILYQGIMHKERPLDKFIEAINELGNQYVFVVMSNGKNTYMGNSTNYFFIPFVQPPYHLDITSHAYIGVLSYFPVKTRYSILNAIFCAPNKIFEYAKFGIPMVSNDVPALKYTFDTMKCGICINDFTVDNIKKAILEIEASYDELSKNSRKYYDSVDWNQILEEILATTIE